MNKNLIVMFCAFLLTSTGARAENMPTNLTALKQRIYGPSLVDTNDPRLIAIIVAGVITAGIGGCLVYDSLSDAKEGKQKSPLRRVLAFIFGNMLISGSFAEMFLARQALSLFDQVSQQLMQEMHKGIE